MVFRLIRPDSDAVWRDERIIKRFSKYKGIIDGTDIARYLVSKTIKTFFDPVNETIEQLENKFLSYSIQFSKLLNVDVEELKEREITFPNLIDLAETIALRYLEKCIFCERRCEVNRKQMEKGYCYLTGDTFVSSAFLHMGEESVLVPSGTIFFQGCNFGCVFCQNYDISQSWKKKRELEDIAQKVDKESLATLAEKLYAKGAININYVGGDPIPNIHTIIGNLNYQTANVCQLWNSNFYLTEESLSLIINFMDFWLPDFKYGNNKCAEKYSGIKNYYDVITRNLKKIHDEGSGEIIIRHLVMPNHIECCTKPILEFIAKEVPKCVVNVMGQFRSEYKASLYPEITRRPSSKEMHEAKDLADKLGILYKPVS